jgi:hypothetical protein
MFSILNKAFGQSAARGLCFRSEFTGPDAAWRWTLGVRVMTFSFIAISSALTSFTILGMVKSWFWIPLWWLLAVCFVAIAIRLYGFCHRSVENRPLIIESKPASGFWFYTVHFAFFQAF